LPSGMIGGWSAASGASSHWHSSSCWSRCPRGSLTSWLPGCGHYWRLPAPTVAASGTGRGERPNLKLRLALPVAPDTQAGGPGSGVAGKVPRLPTTRMARLPRAGPWGLSAGSGQGPGRARFILGRSGVLSCNSQDDEGGQANLSPSERRWMANRTKQPN
jgi:hypothetical protein